MKQVFRSQTNPGLIRKLNDIFKNDDKGKQRNWPDIEEAKIREIFDVCKVKVLVLLDEFKKISIPKAQTVLQEAQTPGGEEEIHETFELN